MNQLLSIFLSVSILFSPPLFAMTERNVHPVSYSHSAVTVQALMPRSISFHWVLRMVPLKLVVWFVELQNAEKGEIILPETDLPNPKPALSASEITQIIETAAESSSRPTLESLATRGATPEEIKAASIVNEAFGDSHGDPINPLVLQLMLDPKIEKNAILFLGPQAFKLSVALALLGHSSVMVLDQDMGATFQMFVRLKKLGDKMTEAGGSWEWTTPSEAQFQSVFDHVSLVDFNLDQFYVREKFYDPLSSFAKEGARLSIGVEEDSHWVLWHLRSMYQTETQGPLSGSYFGGQKPVHIMTLHSISKGNHDAAIVLGLALTTGLLKLLNVFSSRIRLPTLQPVLAGTVPASEKRSLWKIDLLNQLHTVFATKSKHTPMDKANRTARRLGRHEGTLIGNFPESMQTRARRSVTRLEPVYREREIAAINDAYRQKSAAQSRKSATPASRRGAAKGSNCALIAVAVGSWAMANRAVYGTPVSQSLKHGTINGLIVENMGWDSLFAGALENMQTIPINRLPLLQSAS